MELSDLTDEAIDGMWVCNLDLAIARHIYGYETDGEGANGLVVHDDGVCPPDDYASSLEEAWDMERRLAEMGLAERYGEELENILFPEADNMELKPQQKPHDGTWVFRAAHASPRDRCRAALRAIRDARNNHANG